MLKIRPQRATFLLVIVPILLFASSCGSTTDTVGVSYTPPFVPVTFTINSNGTISVQGNLSIESPVGTFALEANVANTLQPEDNTLFVIVRHKQDGRVVDDVYKIQTGQEEVTVVTNGTTTVDVTEHKVFIDVSKGTIKSIEIKSASPAPTPVPTPVSGKVLFQDSLKNEFGNSDGLHDVGGLTSLECCNGAFGANVTVSVTAEMINYNQAFHDNEREYGIVFSSSPIHDVRFGISPYGKWYFVTNEYENYTLPNTFSSAIRQGLGAFNTLKFTVKGLHYDLFVNGTRVGEGVELRDNQYNPNHSISFVAGGGEVVFSNLLVISN